jgi:hypothetical protein
MKLINPRGRVIVVDDKESNIERLLRAGFMRAPDGAEGKKVYNPVFDRGELFAKREIEESKQSPQTTARKSGDVLEVKTV